MSHFCATQNTQSPKFARKCQDTHKLRIDYAISNSKVIAGFSDDCRCMRWGCCSYFSSLSGGRVRLECGVCGCAQAKEVRRGTGAKWRGSSEGPRVSNQFWKALWPRRGKAWADKTVFTQVVESTACAPIDAGA